MNHQPLISDEATSTESIAKQLGEILNGFGIELTEAELAELLARSDEPQEQTLEERVQSHPAVVEAKRQLEQLQFERDLAAIKSKYPDETAESVWELGEPFITIILVGGIDALTAYEIHRARLREAMPEATESIGSARSRSAAMAEFFTPSEVDRLGSDELNDPAILKKIRASMLRWKNK